MKINQDNILVIDECGSSVSYNKSMIESSYEYKPGFDGLPEIFSENHKLIYSVDTSDCLTVIDKSGNELSLCDFYKMNGNRIITDNIDFLKITNPVLKSANAEIYIKAGLYDNDEIQREMAWTDDCESSNQYTYELPDYKNISYDMRGEKACEFIDGYVLCEEMLYNYANHIEPHVDQVYYNHRIFNEPKVLTFCNGFEFENNGNIYKGYLPSLYQMKCIIKYLNIIDYICKDSMPSVSLKIVDLFWTSCEYNFKLGFSAAYQPSYPSDAITCFSMKKERLTVFPIFKKCKKESC